MDKCTHDLQATMVFHQLKKTHELKACAACIGRHIQANKFLAGHEPFKIELHMPSGWTLHLEGTWTDDRVYLTSKQVGGLMEALALGWGPGKCQ